MPDTIRESTAFSRSEGKDHGPQGRNAQLAHGQEPYPFNPPALACQMRPRLVVVHGYHQPGTICLPGETIDRCHLKFQEWEIPIPLSLTALMLADCMVRHHHTPLSIARIERILTNDPFYRRLGTNAYALAEVGPRFTRVSLRVYVARLRKQIAKAMGKGGLIVPPENALISETTDSNVVVHRINLPVEVIHRKTKLM